MKPEEQNAAHSFKCADCGTEINEGEFKTFGVCDACWDKGVTEKYWGPNKQHIVTDKEIIKLAEAELTRLRSELQDTKSYYENKLDARQRIIDRQFSELQQKDEVIKELMRFAFEVRNSTNLNQEGRIKVIKINSIIERATKILKQS